MSTELSPAGVDIPQSFPTHNALSSAPEPKGSYRWLRSLLSPTMSNDLEVRIERSRPAPYRSRGEQLIGRTLDEYGISFLYEPKVTLPLPDFPRTLRPDFYLLDHNTFVEYFGRIGNQDYDLRTQQKLEIYAANDMNLIPIYPWNLVDDWPNYMLDRLRTRVPTQTRYPASRPYPVQSKTRYAGQTGSRSPTHRMPRNLYRR